MKRSIIFISWALFLTVPLSGQCDFQANYASDAGWTQVGTEVVIQTGAVEFDEANGGSQRRVYTQLPTTLNSNDSWKLDFEFTPTAVGTWNSAPAAGHFLVALTAGTQDPINNCPNIACSGYPNGTQDAVMVNLITPDPGDGSINFRIMHRDNGTQTVSGFLPLVGLNLTYYLTFEQLGPKNYQLSVFSDPGRSNPIAGSPISLNTPTSITGLTTIQHGTIAQGNPNRELSGTIDDLCLDLNPVIVIPQEMPVLPFGKIWLLCGMLLGVSIILMKWPRAMAHQNADEYRETA